MKAFLSRFQAKKLRQRSRQWRQNNCLRTQWRGGVVVMANGVSSIEMPLECEAIVVLSELALILSAHAFAKDR